KRTEADALELIGQGHGLLIRRDRVRQLDATRLLPTVGHERVFDLLERRQHRLLIRTELLLRPRILHRDVGPDAPGIEDGPAQGRAERPEAAGWGEQIRELDAF